MERGEPAPDFELPDQDGRPVSLTGLLREGPVALFFYPAAMTAGCTAQSCRFRDLAAEFAELGASRVGVSTDSVAKQREFAERNAFDYPLLSDPDAKVTAAYGVARGVAFAPTRRQTFVIGADRRIIEVVKSEIRMNVHADRALAALRRQAADPAG
ncbi:peroxiredoxin [Allonocardiopsis opalescens]|uniref:thioredoxin-dependent peroxiredoxin n=1 Tax=Allonocardiopsis opalescens TaxID=1144618 RepID=A0A2T0Q0N5_9ACTN|nr:peroxiredoxin [Allonocardiopsis opalescens]PRX97326.1 peroxiredoxin Q/BCP [Allonocardiopsis opalescens]